MCNKPLLKARSELLELLNVDVKNFKPTKNPEHKESDYPQRVVNEDFMEELEKAKIEFSTDFEDRFIRCRGQGLKDFYILRYGKFPGRIPDIVVFPKSHEDIVLVVELSKKFCAVIGRWSVKRILCRCHGNMIFKTSRYQESFHYLSSHLFSYRLTQFRMVEEQTRLLA